MKDSTASHLGDHQSAATESYDPDDRYGRSVRTSLNNDAANFSGSVFDDLLGTEGSGRQSQQTRMTGDPSIATLLRASGRGIKAVGRKGMDWTQDHLGLSKSTSGKGALRDQRMTTVEVREDPRAVQSGGERSDVHGGWGRGTKGSREEGAAVYGDGKPP